jgi:hypothetical protein
MFDHICVHDLLTAPCGWLLNLVLLTILNLAIAVDKLVGKTRLAARRHQHSSAAFPLLWRLEMVFLSSERFGLRDVAVLRQLALVFAATEFVYAFLLSGCEAILVGLGAWGVIFSDPLLTGLLLLLLFAADGVSDATFEKALVFKL